MEQSLKAQGVEEDSWKLSFSWVAVAICISAALGSWADGHDVFHGGLSDYSAGRDLKVWNLMDRWPFLVAATIFSMQTIAGICLVALRHSLQSLTRDGHRFCQMIMAYVMISAPAAVMYLIAYICTMQVTVDTPEGGIHLVSRNFHWTWSTPLQWYIFIHACAKAPDERRTELYESTIAMQITGGLLYVVKSLWLQRLCYWMSCACFALMFYRAWQIDTHFNELDSPTFGITLRYVMFLLWLAYPISYYMGRWLMISNWTEQVLLLTVLDICVKSVTFSIVITVRVVSGLSAVWGSMQLVQASHDLVLVFNENFCLLDSLRSSQAVMHYFKDSLAENSLVDLIGDDQSRAMFLEAARTADRSGPRSPTPKCALTLKLPRASEGEGNLYIECKISKCIHGRRIIGLGVQESSRFDVPTFPSEDGGVGESYDSVSEVNSLGSAGSLNFSMLSSHISPSEAAYHRRLELEEESRCAKEPRFDPSFDANQMQPMSYVVPKVPASDIQLTLALHNCGEMLELTRNQLQHLHALFTQANSICAVFFHDVQSEEIILLAVSCQMRSLFSQAMQFPKPLDQLIEKGVVSHIRGALKRRELLLYQHSWARLRQCGVGTRISVMPLDQVQEQCLSGPTEQLSERIGVVLFDIIDQENFGSTPKPGFLRQPSKGKESEQTFWYAVDGNPISVTCTEGHIVEQTFRNIQGKVWSLFIETPLKDSLEAEEEDGLTSAPEASDDDLTLGPPKAHKSRRDGGSSQDGQLLAALPVQDESLLSDSSLDLQLPAPLLKEASDRGALRCNSFEQAWPVDLKELLLTMSDR